MSWWDDFVKGADDAPTIEEQNRQQAMADALDRNGPGGGYNPFTDYKPTDDPSAVGRGTYVDDQGQWGYSNADEWMKNMGTGPGGMAHEVAPYLGALTGAMVGAPISMMASGLNASGIDVDPISQLTKLAGRGSKGGPSASPSGGSSAGAGSAGPMVNPNAGYMPGAVGVSPLGDHSQSEEDALMAAYDAMGNAGGMGANTPAMLGAWGQDPSRRGGQMADALAQGGAAKRMKVPDYTGGMLQFGF